jgi:hypothetical protein
MDQEFVLRLVNMANANEKVMDGSMEPVKRIAAEADVLFAVWQDPEEEYGVGYLIVKGEKLLKSIVTSGDDKHARINAIKCIEKEQAVALKRLIGLRDYDA